MGIYVFTARFLFEQLCRDATDPDSAHDFGRNIIPSIIDSHRVYAFPFRDENRKGDAYWRDVGTLDAYYDANMDLVSIDPQLNMYDAWWPIRTYQPILPPPKFVFGSIGSGERQGCALDSIVCQGSVVSGGRVERSILGPLVRVNSYACMSRTRSCFKAWISVAMPRSDERSSTRESGFRRESRSVTTSTKIANAVSQSAKAESS